ncbi:OpgC domain-containing protein [Bradyrhizobium sp.]|uniref:OpgC domain-containing protein n=1 Tax=Bradyrhizobium sp. TaxID=376 RepID=UPI003C666D4F
MNPSVKAYLEKRGHDLRIDLLRGFANWFIFLDHIPNDAVNLLTLRNFGFSGATDVFVFVAGYAAAIIYGKMAMERSFVVMATRIFKRVWQLYAAYVVLFVIYVDVIGNVATQYATTELFDEYNVTGIVDHPTRTLMHGLLLQAKPLNLDALQLFIALMAFLPPALWLMLRRPNLALAGSIALYFAARHFDWSLPSFPTGSWYFNPFCWQLLFVLGTWFALHGHQLTATLHRLPLLRIAALAYLGLALAITVAGHSPQLGSVLSDLGLDPIMPGDKENLPPLRVVHFLALALVFSYLVPKDWSPLSWKILDPVMKGGEEWLSVFCIGVFLSFAGHFLLITGPNSLIMQVLVSVGGILVMTGVAYYISWSKRQDHRPGLAFH